MTPHQYVEANLAMKGKNAGLARLHEPDAKPQRYRDPGILIVFLKTL